MDRFRHLSLRYFLLIAGVLLLVGMLGAGAAGGYWYWQRLQEQQSWYDYGMEAYEEGDYLVAYRVLQRWLVQHPDDVDTLRVYADSVSRVAEDRLDHLRRAATAYNQILRHQPDDYEAHEELCRLYRRVEMWGNLLTYTESELLRDPDDLMFQFYRALALHEIGRLDSAMESYLEQIERDTPYYEAYLNAARIFVDRGFATRAEEVLQEGVNAHPDSALMRLQVAHFYSINKQPDRTNAAFEAAFELESDSEEVWVAQSRHLNLQKRYAEAARAAERALEIDPSLGAAYGQLALSYERLGRTQEAIEMLKNLDLLVRVDHSTLQLSLAEMQLAEGDLEGMERTVQEYMAAYPSHRAVKEYFDARRMLLEGDAEGAAASLALVHEEAPGFGPAHFFLAVAYREAGNRMMARATLDSYRRNYPDDERARIIEVRDFQTQSQTIGEARVNAQAILGDPFSEVETLLAGAVALFDAARRENRLEAEIGLVRQLIDMAIEKRPNDQRAYRAMADMYVAVNDIEAATAIIEEAVGGGVPAEQLAVTRANLALARGETEEARHHLLADLEQPGVDRERILRWTSFLRARNENALALEAVAVGREKVTGDARFALDAEYATALARVGDIEAAQAALDALEASAPESGIVPLVQARLEVARALLEQQDAAANAAASALIARAAADRPEDPLVLVLRAEELLRRTPPDFDGAQELLAYARQQHPDDMRVLAGLSAIAESRGDLAGALELALKASELAPNLVSVQVRTAELLLQLRRHNDALAQTDRILAAAPNEPNAMGVRTAALLGTGQLAQAREVLAALENIHGNDPAVQPLVRALRNRVMTAGGEGEQALALLREDHQREPNALSIAEAYAQKLVQLGQGGEAVGVIQAYADTHATEPGAWVALARVHAALNIPESLDRASESLTRALVLAPHDAGAMRQMIDIQMRRGNLTEALALCERYLTIRPNQPEVLFQKARLLAARPGGREESLAIINQALSVADQPEYRGFRGMLLLEQGDFEKARADLQAVAAAQPSTTAMLDLALAETHAGLRDFVAAHSYLQSAQRKQEAGQVIDIDRLERVGLEIEQGVGT